MECYVWKYENVMIWLICCMHDMIWLTCKTTTNIKYNSDICMKVMINDTINIMRNIMKNVIWERYRDLMYYCVFMHRGTLLLFHDITNVYATRQENDHYVWHSAVVSWRSLLLTGVQHQQLPEYARLTRKGPKRCANRLVGS